MACTCMYTHCPPDPEIRLASPVKHSNTTSALRWCLANVDEHAAQTPSVHCVALTATALSAV
jgi:hypothetical protein